MIRHLTSSALVFDADRVLLVYHRKLNLWLYPGGHLDPNEDPHQCVLREIHEELGIDIEVITGDNQFSHPAIRVIPSPFVTLVENVRDSKHGQHEHIDLVYVCRPLNHEITSNATELDGHAWVELNEVANLITPPELPSLIAEAHKFYLTNS